MLFPKIKETLTEKWGLNNLYLETDDEWSSANPQHRLLIREQIYKHLPIQELLDLKQLPDPKQSPEWANTSYSISHCKSLGGFLVVMDTMDNFGMDIEIIARCQPNMVLRISEEKELSMAPSPAALWCAKEAVFKAAPRIEQPATISDIEVFNWSPIYSLSQDQLAWECQAQLKHKNIKTQISGLVFVESGHCLAFSKFKCRN